MEQALVLALGLTIPSTPLPNLLRLQPPELLLVVPQRSSCGCRIPTALSKCGNSELERMRQATAFNVLTTTQLLQTRRFGTSAINMKRFILFLLAVPATVLADGDDVTIRQRNTGDTAFVDRVLPADQVIDTWPKYLEEAGAASLSGGNGFSGKQTFGDYIAVSGAAITLTEASPDTGVISITELLNTVTVDENTTLSLSSDSAATGDRFGVRITNGAASDVTITLKRSDGTTDLAAYSQSFGANRSTFIVPASGTVTVILEDTGTNTYNDLGSFPVPLITQLGTQASPDTTAGAITISGSVNGLIAFCNTTTEYDLEAAANWKYKVAIFYNAGTNTITIDPNASEVIVLDGTALTGGDRITISGTAGDYVALYSDGTRIITLGREGTISDAN